MTRILIALPPLKGIRHGPSGGDMRASAEVTCPVWQAVTRKR